MRKVIPSIHNAWLQGNLRRQPGAQPGEDPYFPKDQFYNPPEDKPIATNLISETADERVELQEFRYTRVKVTQRKATDGSWAVTSRDLADVRLNPWWYSPGSIYTPANDGTGGPFTIGRVIHSSRSVGFTGWIGGVAVFNRALTAEDMVKLAAMCRPVANPE